MKSPPASFKIILAPNVWQLSHLTDEPEPVMRLAVRIALISGIGLLWTAEREYEAELSESCESISLVLCRRLWILGETQP